MICNHYLILLSVLGAAFSKTLLMTDIGQRMAFYQCLKMDGINQVIIHFSPSDPKTSTSTVIAAKNSDLLIQIWMQSCRNDTVSWAVTQFFKYLDGYITPTVWLTPVYQGPEETCNWDNYTPESNCKYLGELITGFARKFVNIHIYINRKVWADIFDSEKGCPEISERANLWWIPMPDQQSSRPDFEMYSQIGGWEQPTMKSYGEQRGCGKPLKAVYYR